jgi:putative transposase
MGRLPRPVADGLLYHALNRGNNRASVFGDHGDFRAFLRALVQTGQRYLFRLYGYCLMTNHFHLLLEPCEGQSISRILQSLTVARTWRYHRRHQTVGHVWQGRFKSPVILLRSGSESCLLGCCSCMASPIYALPLYTERGSRF